MSDHSAPLPDRELDARGLKCPLPVLRTKKALNEMRSGQILRVTTTDPASVADFAALARQTGNELCESTQIGREYRFLFRRK